MSRLKRKNNKENETKSEFQQSISNELDSMTWIDVGLRVKMTKEKVKGKNFHISYKKLP